ncbi:hypothetical protein [Phenylobacterium sp.]|uniref:hypothetical protein n=1 Tax=Phenylobacterium sp. TaxID=1871053 RepID=UPI002C5B55CB|nr:hypothetical protein [Phenylobacterium sp.]HLZ75562.1 hypothetical protein [Phenylobacterium sp.]
MSDAARPRPIIFKPSWRRYMLRFTAAMASYVAVLLAVDFAVRDGFAPPKPWLYLVALAPALPVAAVVFVVLRYLQEEEDEYMRMLNIQAYVAATGLTLTVCTGWGFLQDFAGLPRIALTQVFVIFCVCQGLTTGWTRLRRR